MWSSGCRNAGLRQLADEGDTIAEGAPDAGGRWTRQLPHGLEPFPPELNVSQADMIDSATLSPAALTRLH